MSGSRSEPEPERLRDLDAIVAGYLDRLNDGERLHPEDVLLSHPELGPAVLEELRAFIDIEREPVDPEAAEDRAPRRLGDYTLLGVIGRGGMGVVYEAHEHSMDRRVALKVLPQSVATAPGAVTRFLREARIAGKLNHPNVVPVYATGVQGSVPYYAMLTGQSRHTSFRS